MQTFFTVLSIFLGVANLVQLLASIVTGSSMRATAQASYNDWYRVAQVGDEIAKNPLRAAELIRNVNGIADSARNHVKAYSWEKLGFDPTYDAPWEGGANPAPKQSFWRQVGFAFTAK